MKSLNKKFGSLLFSGILIFQPVLLSAENLNKDIQEKGHPQEVISSIDDQKNSKIKNDEELFNETTESKKELDAEDSASVEEIVSDTKESTETTESSEVPEENIVSSENNQIHSSEENTSSKENPVTDSIWKNSVIGSSASASKNTVTENENGSVTIASVNGGGKILETGSDGMNFYYTPIKKTDNFSLRGTIKVDTWTYSNGQEGFMLLAQDALPSDNYVEGFYSNSYALVGGRYSYKWDSTENKVSSNGDKTYDMRLGMSTRLISGITSSTQGATSSLRTPLETTAGDLAVDAGRYNIMGNLSNPEALTTIGSGITEVQVEMKKTNTGFEIFYTAPTGEVKREILYDWEELFTQDSEYVYVGFAAARNMTITVSDIQLQLSDPATDPAPEERPKVEVEPVYTIDGAKTTGSKDYSLGFLANVSGNIKITNETTGEILVEEEAIVANEKHNSQFEIVEGVNNLKVNFTPDPSYMPSENEIMSNYDPVALSHSVTLNTETLNTLYVSPEGKSDNTGEENSPLDLQTAVAFARSGQTILLAGGTYHFTNSIFIDKAANGTAEKPIVMMAKDSTDRPIFDFGRNSAGIVHWGSYWEFYDFDVTNTKDLEKGFQISGHYNHVENIQTYRNGNTGLQISGLGSDTIENWPSHNLIKNCTSFENADAGFEDADGFAAKLTVGEGNVFDGCIAYNNADDGWDLFAKDETGSIGAVTIKNSVAYRNGFIPGVEKTGNGNGFKMGGTNIPGEHVLINSLAFENLAKGIDSNSGPNIHVYQSTSFNNDSYNVAFYTNINQKTNYEAQGILSFRTENLEMKEQFKGISQDETLFKGVSNYYWDEVTQTSVNSEGKTLNEDVFANLAVGENPVTRYANGSINVNGLMQPMDETTAGLSGIGARFTESTTPDTTRPTPENPTDPIDPEIPETPNTTLPTQENSPIQLLEVDGHTKNPEKYLFPKVKFTIGVNVFTPNTGAPVEGDRQYTPVSYALQSESGNFNTLSRTTFAKAELTAPNSGSYELVVTYNVGVYNGTTYEATEEQVQQKMPLNVLTPSTSDSTDDSTNSTDSSNSTTDSENKKDETGKLPQTGELQKGIFAFSGLALVVLSGLLALLKREDKKKKS